MSLIRILEAEIMDTEEDALEYDSIPNDDVNRLFVQQCLLLVPERGKVLDVGTGTAKIPILLARARPGLKITGTDMSKEMLRLGAKNVKIAGVGGTVELKLVDAKHSDFEEGEFDAIISNSIVHHIPAPRDFFREVARIGSRDAGYLFKDLLRPATIEALDSLVRQHASDCNEYQRRLFRNSLHAALTVAEVKEFVEGAGIEGCSIEQTSDRHWTLTRPFHFSQRVGMVDSL